MEKLACHIDSLNHNSGLEVKLEGREVVLWKVNNKVFCIDNKCWHASSPLQFGDIEEYSGRTCVVCPSHKYIIDLETGEDITLVEQKRFIFKKKPLAVANKVRQRTHTVRVTETGDVYVTLSALKEKISSDRNYAELDKNEETKAGPSIPTYILDATLVLQEYHPIVLSSVSLTNAKEQSLMYNFAWIRLISLSYMIPFFYHTETVVDCVYLSCNV
eukprot:CFRG5079T1